jgi:hypothetical protein
VILLSDEQIPRELGIKKGNKLFNAIPDAQLKNMQDDDDIIDYFLNNQDKFEVCEYFKKGNCKYGAKCKYYHPPDLASKKDKNGE